MIFSSMDGKLTFELSDSKFPGLLNIIQSAQGKETGGILIGKYSPDHSVAIVTKLTGPPKDSKSGRTWFHRGILGLPKLLHMHWNKKEYYLGEWHYHPFSSPNPSYQDIEQMRTIAESKSYHCPEPIMLIIGGDVAIYAIRVFVSLKGKEIIELLKKN